MRSFSEERHPLLTVAEVAGMLRLSTGTVNNWLSQKRLERVKVGRKTYIRRKEVESLLWGTSQAGPYKNNKELL